MPVTPSSYIFQIGWEIYREHPCLSPLDTGKLSESVLAIFIFDVSPLYALCKAYDLYGILVVPQIIS
jgi:hypothetical protein